MKSKAAILRQAPGKWQIEELELSDPGPNDVQIRIEAAGLCHSDDHFATGDTPAEHYPLIGGHEGAGVVTAVGSDVRSVAVGDHVVTIFIPSCGKCRWCAAGMGNLCDEGARIMAPGGGKDSFNFHTSGGENVGQMALLGTFSQWTVVPEQSVIKISKDIPFTSACLLACGVPTGWGAATSATNVSAGDTVIVMGVGGIGINSVQGARHVGAAHVLAVDPEPLKRDTALTLGATEAFENIEAAAERAQQLTNGQGADSTLVSVGVLTSEMLAPAFGSIRKGGTLVLTSLGRHDEAGIPINLMELALFQKRIQGSLFGAQAPREAVPRLAALYQTGALKIDELVTRTYGLDQVNEAYEDMHGGKVVRAVIDMTH